MTIYFLSTTFILLYGVLTNANINREKRKHFIIISFFLLIIIAALRAPTVGNDLVGHYVRRYQDVANYSWDNLVSFSSLTQYEIGYCYFIKILETINPNVQFYIVICSILIYSSIAYFIYKESDDVIMSTMLLIFTCTYYMCMTMIRQGIAFSLVLIGYTKLDHSDRTVKNYVVFALWILLASTFHNSALLCLSMILFDRLRFTRKDILIGTVAIIFLYEFYQKAYDYAINLIGAGDNYERYITSLTEGSGNTNFQSVINFLLTLFCFLLGYYLLVGNRKTVKSIRREKGDAYRLERRESFMMYMVLIASACRLLIFKMNIINRFTYYFIPFLFILYPHVIESVHMKSNRWILRDIVYLVFGVYFVWITMTKAESFYGTVPYQFFWQ